MKEVLQNRRKENQGKIKKKHKEGETPDEEIMKI